MYMYMIAVLLLTPRGRMTTDDARERTAISSPLSPTSFLQLHALSDKLNKCGTLGSSHLLSFIWIASNCGSYSTHKDFPIKYGSNEPTLLLLGLTLEIIGASWNSSESVAPLTCIKWPGSGRLDESRSSFGLLTVSAFLAAMRVHDLWLMNYAYLSCDCILWNSRCSAVTSCHKFHC